MSTIEDRIIEMSEREMAARQKWRDLILSRLASENAQSLSIEEIQRCCEECVGSQRLTRWAQALIADGFLTEKDLRTERGKFTAELKTEAKGLRERAETLDGLAEDVRRDLAQVESQIARRITINAHARLPATNRRDGKQ